MWCRRGGGGSEGNSSPNPPLLRSHCLRVLPSATAFVYFLISEDKKHSHSFVLSSNCQPVLKYCNTLHVTFLSTPFGSWGTQRPVSRLPSDPAFVVLQVFFLVCAAAAYVVAFAPTVSQGVRLSPGTLDNCPNSTLRMLFTVNNEPFVLFGVDFSLS